MYVNALALRPDGAGISTYIRELLTAMPFDARMKVSALVQRDAVDELPAGVTVDVIAPVDGMRRSLGGALARPPRGPVHGLDSEIPLLTRGPSVLTVHDLAVFDVPWAFSRARALGKQALMRHALRRADAVIAVSPFTASRVWERFGISCTPIPLAASPDLTVPGPAECARVRSTYDLPPRFVLTVGSYEPRKCHAALESACVTLGVPLVAAGSGYPATSRVQRLGFVPRCDLPALYRVADATAYISAYEGFGLPPLEAAACGAAVVCSPVASLREVLGDAAEFVSADPVDLARGLGLVLADVERNAWLRRRGPEVSAGFTWTEAAAATLDVWRSL